MNDTLLTNPVRLTTACHTERDDKSSVVGLGYGSEMSMIQPIPIKLKTADVFIESMGGIRVIHAIAGGNEDAPSLVSITEAIEYGCEETGESPIQRYFLDYENEPANGQKTKNRKVPNLYKQHASHEPDLQQSLQLSLSNIETHIEGNYVWLVVDVNARTLSRAHGLKALNQGYETFLFHFEDGKWKVIHTHGSPR